MIDAPPHASVLDGRVVVAVVRDTDVEVARRIAIAAADALPAVEVTFTVPEASGIIEELSDHPRVVLGQTIVGAGTVSNRAVATQAIDAGAEFLVGPNFDSEIATLATASGVAYIPGAFSPTEIFNAARYGCSTIKLFPAAVLGTRFLRAMVAVAPHLHFVPTGGVDRNNACEWFDAGALAVGVGSSLNSAFVHGGDAALAAEVAALAALAALPESLSPVPTDAHAMNHNGDIT